MLLPRHLCYIFSACCNTYDLLYLNRREPWIKLVHWRAAVWSKYLLYTARLPIGLTISTYPNITVTGTTVCPEVWLCKDYTTQNMTVRNYLTGLMITTNHQTFSDQLKHLSSQIKLGSTNFLYIINKVHKTKWISRKFLVFIIRTNLISLIV